MLPEHSAKVPMEVEVLSVSGAAPDQAPLALLAGS